MDNLPPQFLERLKKILPQDDFAPSLKGFHEPRPLAIRMNPLKIERSQALGILQSRGVVFKGVHWYQDALILENITTRDPRLEDLLNAGQIYIQSLSSMLPALVLNPKPGEDILDTCAAPGSKTTQMAALMETQGTLTALENVKERYYKLKTVVSLLGAANVTLRLCDARRFRPAGKHFDKILVDVPCSSEGRFHLSDKKTYAYWSLRKIKEMAEKQKGILLSASRLLKPGGELVYSTCTFAPEENESAVDWLLKKTGGEMETVAVSLPGIGCYPVLETWRSKQFNPQVTRCLRILPAQQYEGFFIAKLAKKSSP